MRKKPYKRNALYELLGEFLRNQPHAKPREAWNHIVSLIPIGATPGLIAFDGTCITFAPDPEHLRTKIISRNSFARTFQRLRKEKPPEGGFAVIASELF